MTRPTGFPQLVLPLFAVLLLELSSSAGARSISEPQAARLRQTSPVRQPVRLNDLAEALQNKDNNKALEYARQALEQSRQMNHRTEEARALINLCAILNYLNKSRDSLQPGEDGVALARKLGNKRLVARGLTTLGRTYRGLLQPEKVEKCHQEALLLAEEVGDKVLQAQALNGLAILARAQNERDKAMAYHERAFRLREEIKDRSGMAVSLFNLALLSMDLTRNDKAAEYTLRALQIQEELGETTRMAASYQQLGTIYTTLENFPQALEYYRKAYELIRTFKDRTPSADLLTNIGLVQHQSGNIRAALDSFSQALTLYQQLGVRTRLATAQNNVGWAYLGLGEYEKALALLVPCLPLCDEFKDSYTKAAVLDNIGTCQFHLKQYPQAHQSLEQALRLAQEKGYKNIERNVYGDLADVYRELRDFENALGCYEKMTTLKEALSGEETTRRTAELQTRYETEKKQKEIELLTRDKQIQDLKLGAQQTHIQALQQDKELQQLSLLAQEQELSVLERDRQIQVLALSKSAAEAERQAKQIELLQKDAALQKAVRNSLLGAFATVLVSLLALSGLYVVKKRSELKLQLKNEEISRQKEVVEQQAQDLEAQRQALLEANLKLTEADRLKADFTAMLVHDLKSPLSVVNATLQLMGEDELVQQHNHQLLSASQRSVEKMLTLINEVLRVFRSDSQEIPLHPVPLNPASLLTETIEEARLAARSGSITVESHFFPDLPLIAADRIELGRVLANLLANAIKFTPVNGVIRLEARLQSGQGGEEGLTFLRISITDTGDGIPAEDLPYLFDPYRQASSKKSGLGVGLGLAIVKRIVAAHGGTVTVCSQLGVGSCFSILLPTIEPVVMAATQPSIPHIQQP
ncbi:MAG: tetratricopeptide repeat protein [Blastocatellia bacterium]|nr:tetratricopeptide repeat protein [Blastocatellia bacterium]